MVSFFLESENFVLGMAIPKSVERGLVWKPGRVKGLSIVFDYYVGGMLDLAKNDCALSL